MQAPSLYSRLGGYDAIAAVCDDLLERLLSDPQLNWFWRGHSRDTMRRERQMLVDFLCEAAGGPSYYTGRDMVTAHRGLAISESHWDCFVKHAVETFDKFDVPEAERQDVFAFVSSLKGHIVNQ
jgi:hemoglobin